MSGLVKILSIDGGGIRGIIPAMVLMEIEKRTGKSIASQFDLIAGTSTGGILALGMTVRDSNNLEKPRFGAQDTIKLYENEGRKIFSRSPWHRIRSLDSAADEKYPTEGIEGVLEEYFGEARLKDVLTDVLVTAYEIEGRFPFLFKSSRAKKDPEYDFPIVQVARATSAAPTYFEALKLKTVGSSDYYALIDGGVYANNPAMCAYIEAKTMYPDADDFLVVSLGTGQMTRPLLYDEVKNWGLIQWARPILDVVFDGVSDTVDYQLKQLLPQKVDGKSRYFRIQARLDEGYDDIDDASKTNLRVLKLIAQEMIHKQNDAIQMLCSILTE